jgi:hypothetical protein
MRQFLNVKFCINLTLVEQFFIEGPERVKWELGFACFLLGKWDFMRWVWDS